MPRKLTTEEVIQKFKKVHGDKYDYSKIKYVNTMTNIEIICNIHGSFYQCPNTHIFGHGCPKCGNIKAGKSNSKRVSKNLIKNFKKIHGDKYDYSKVSYINAKTKIEIICPIHGSFYQFPTDHLITKGCQKCSNKYVPSTNEIIKNFKKIHGDKYDYNKVSYINAKTKIEIMCPEHGSFYQTPNDHLFLHGCPNCKSSKGENKIYEVLEQLGINFETQKIFKKCKNKKCLPFDFYLPDLNILIEYDGQQHFRPIKYFGGEEAFLKTRQNDKIKTSFAKSNNINLIRISYKEFDNIENVLNPLKTKHN